MTQKERLVIDRFENYMYENEPTSAFVQEILQKLLDTMCAGSAEYWAEKGGISAHQVRRTCDKLNINGLNIYLKAF